MKYIFGILLAFFCVTIFASIYMLIMYNVTGIDDTTLYLDMILLLKYGFLFVGSAVSANFMYKLLMKEMRN